MLGFAFSEAQRSQEIMRRLNQQKANSSSQALSSTGGAMAPKAGGGHKRTRRRRRPKKHHGGSASVGSSTATASTVGMTSRQSVGTARSLYHQAGTAAGATVKKQHDAPMTKRDLYFSLRCGIVNVSGGETAVGRVTLVNWDDEIVLDTFVKVPVPITDYRTSVTGITPGLLERGASSLDSVRKKVAYLIRGKILIGHGLEVDLLALRLNHPWCDIRDTATYAPYMQVVDPLTGILLPRSLEDLMRSALPQPVSHGQPVLVTEAIACLALYKAARERWEDQLVQILQQKEKQREMVMNMRSTSHGHAAGESMGVQPQLSRIAEDASGEVPPVMNDHCVSTNTSYGYPRDHFIEYETSTLASDPFESYDCLREDDDFSETSSFVTTLEPGLNPLFENLHVLPELGESAGHEFPVGSSSTTGNSRAVPPRPFRAWAQQEGSPTNHPPGIWTLFPPAGSTLDSAATGGWSHGSSPTHHASDVLPRERVGVPSVGTTDEDDFRGHLPAHLLEDLDVVTPISRPKEEQEEPKKKSWFGLGRRRRSFSVSSAPSGEGAFAELKSGFSKLSLSDRTPRRSGSSRQGEV